MPLEDVYLQSILKRLLYYKELGDKTFAQLNEEQFFYQPNEESNSIAIIIQHMAGNMLSRFTDFLTSDGEKEWRNRDDEFIARTLSKNQLIEQWEEGWRCCLDAIKALKDDDLIKEVYIRKEKHTVIDALNRQLAHYPYHVGQIIYVAKIILDKKWENLSIARGGSAQFNQQTH